MIVQATNTGGDLAGNQFDLSVRLLFSTPPFLSSSKILANFIRFPAAASAFSMAAPMNGELQAQVGGPNTAVSHLAPPVTASRKP
jgi:hypothetical protein